MALLLLAGNAYATMIDSFDVSYTNPVLLVYPVPLSPQTVLDMQSGSTSDIIGGFRDTQMDYVSGTGIAYSTANLAGSGTLDFAQGPNTSAKLTLIWDGDNNQGLTSNITPRANLTSGGATGWVTDIENIDIDLTYMVEIYTDSSHASVYSDVFHGGASGPQYVDFSQFTVLQGASGGADFSNVGAIKFILDGTNHPDADVSINAIGTAAPEPATFALMLSGLMGLSFHVYRRRGK